MYGEFSPCAFYFIISLFSFFSFFFFFFKFFNPDDPLELILIQLHVRFIELTRWFVSSALCDIIRNETLFLVLILQENFPGIVSNLQASILWFSVELSKNVIDQPFPLKRDIVSDFRCFHPSHTSSDRKLRRCESATRNDVEANQSMFIDFSGDQDDEFSEAACLDYCGDSSIPLRSG